MSKKTTIPEDKLKAYDELIASFPDIERKGATMPYTSLNGHMFSFLDKEGTMSIRLSKDVLADFLQKHNTELSVQHGRIMKEYAVVPDGLLQNQEEMKAVIQSSYDYIATLKPKPTKKKKA
ncbi:hypothetical protein KFE98_05855 [bacterium SCSIO 12741]|nr:hypothetical protein KFE98_05855 [bacterium SCSIO 12741]